MSGYSASKGCKWFLVQPDGERHCDPIRSSDDVFGCDRYRNHLGGQGANLQLQRYLAAGHQHWDDHRDISDGLPHSTHPKSRIL